MSKFGDKLRARREKKLSKKTERRISKGKHTMSREDRRDAKKNRKLLNKHLTKTTGKTGVERKVDAVKAKVDKVKKTKVGKTISKITKTIDKGKDTNVYKVVKGARDTFRQLKKGKLGKAYRTIRDTKKSLNRKNKEE